MQHYLWLKLSGDLAAGSHTIDFPAATGLDNYAFEYDDRTTRCSSIQASHVGHAAADPLKMAYMSALPFGVGFGPQTFSQTEFHVINSVGGIVYTGDIALSMEEDDYGTTVDNGWPTGLWVVDTTVPVKTVTGASIADPVVITSNGHGYTQGFTNRVTLNGVGATGTALSNSTQTWTMIVGATTANTFAIYREVYRILLTFSTTLSAGNTYNGTINGVSIGPVAFATSHAATMNAIAAAIEAAKADTNAVVSGNTISVYQTA
jgi:hypothetical protein